MDDCGRQTLLIIDFGSQYTRLIARRARELNVHSRILSYRAPFDEIAALSPRGVILSGGPASVLDRDAPLPDERIFSLGCPILGICYGLQAVARLFGGKVERADHGEYGKARLVVEAEDPIFEGLPRESTVWMSHGDRVLPSETFVPLARTGDCPLAAVRHRELDFRGLQFHPEVSHSEFGARILENFLFSCCCFDGDWRMEAMAERFVEEVRRRVGDGGILVALSGGVDSSVTAAICARAVGRRAHAVFVDNGLLRKGEREEVARAFEDFELDLRVVDASGRFLSALAGVADPEEKRKRIGHTFIDVFRNEASRMDGVSFLAQGTLYPDVIESSAPGGSPSATIKSHHNVGGLPEDLGFELVEPLRELFKDEVRRLGRLLGLPEHLVERHPFPGPGLAVRMIGEVERHGLEMLREADAVFLEEIRRAGLYSEVFQSFAVLLPPMSVGVMGDGRTEQRVVALRCVDSQDAMTADWSRLPHELLERAATRIINEVPGVNRVVYDISSKPPATIEWE